MVDLNNISMETTMDENGEVYICLYRLINKKQRVRINYNKLAPEEKKYVKARFSYLIRQQANAWQEFE